MAIASAMMAFQRQAVEWVASTRSALAAAGLGFGPDDLAAIAASAAARPTPATEASASDIADALEAGARAMAADYPPDGFPPDDPRLALIDGVSLAQYAMASQAIGWAPDDADLVARVCRALGLDAATWASASEGWNRRIQGDVVLAAFYGQLFVAAAA